MALVDVATFDRHVDNLSYEAVAVSVVRQTQQERMFAWGCPEGGFQIRVASTLDETACRPVESIEGVIRTSGNLCITSYGNLLFVAQFAQSPFPHEEPMFGDALLSVAPGRYAIEVHRMFQWEHGEQYPDELNEGDNFVIVLKPITSQVQKKPYQQIPWTYG
jgi:hypothetical protein